MPFSRNQIREKKQIHLQTQFLDGGGGLKECQLDGGGHKIIGIGKTGKRTNWSAKRRGRQPQKETKGAKKKPCEGVKREPSS